MPSKWIEIASPSVPAAEVAAEALRLRGPHVAAMLSLAAYDYQSDSEHIHQLRVACRRGDATLKAFRPLLGNKSAPLRKWLRRIRRAAGPARNLDVLLAGMRKRRDADPNHTYLVARLQRKRIETQKALLKVNLSSQGGKFQQRLDRCLAVLAKKKNSRITIGEFAQKALQKASRPVLRMAGMQEPTLEQLHELRIAGKRLRYSIEIFSGALDPNLRTELYPLVEKLQSRLGRMNDHATAQALLQRLLVGMPADSRAAYLARCIADQYEASQRMRGDFLSWWTPERVALLESYLSTLK